MDPGPLVGLRRFHCEHLFVGMLLCLEIGRRIGVRRLQDDSSAGTEGIGAVDGAVFAVHGLLIAFTFSGVSARFDGRRQLIIEETNNIRTAYLRLDMIGAEAQPALRDSFRAYLDPRLEAYRKLPDLKAVQEGFDRANEISAQIWRRAVEAVRSKDAPPTAAFLLLPALNAMIDITTTRALALQMHPPLIVFVMLFGLALAASLLAGYGMMGSKMRTPAWA